MGEVPFFIELHAAGKGKKNRNPDK